MKIAEMGKPMAIRTCAQEHFQPNLRGLRLKHVYGIEIA
jgi:hypothetical protein